MSLYTAVKQYSKHNMSTTEFPARTLNVLLTLSRQG